MIIPRNPYPIHEFIGMVIRRYKTPAEWNEHSEPGKLILKNDCDPNFWIGFVGDICPLKSRNAQFSSEIIHFFKDCTIMVGNFEGVITDKRSWPFLLKHTPIIFDSLDSIKPLDRWVLSLANNHAIDYGIDALNKTILQFENLKINWLGTIERPSTVIFDRISLTAWTWWVNGHTDRLSVSDPRPPKWPGIHIATPHWGYEHERLPRNSQRSKIPVGYDLIVGHHSHLPQPMELDSSGTPIIWSLGNFLTSNKLKVLSEGALMKAGFILNKNNKPLLHSIHYQPIILKKDNPEYCKVDFRPVSKI